MVSARKLDANKPQSKSQSTPPHTSAASAQQAPAQSGPTSKPSRRLLPMPHLPGRWEHDSYMSTAMFEFVDRAFDATMARSTLGLSPQALLSFYTDWAMGLAFSPGKRAQLVDKAFRKYVRFLNYAATVMTDPSHAECCIEPLVQDKRFASAEWQRPPYNLIAQSFLLTQQWWHNATIDINGVRPQTERAVEFAARQVLDFFSPSNYILTNPDLFKHTLDCGGSNLVQGFQNLLEDWQRNVSGQPPVGAEQFQVGRDVAITPGKVVYRNELIELIQYEPTTAQVHPEPVLIVPAWIMKYYILDLSPDNSLVKHLVDQGFTVFMISWRNPEAEHRDFGLDDYRELGPMAALDAITAITKAEKVHGAGYCLGGTLLSMAAATMARDGDDRFESLSLLATQVDFEEAGELMLFINDKQLRFLENMMWEQGFLDTKQMAGAFQMMRSNDLIWSRIEHDYLMGRRRPVNDLMAWNADGTRMPYRMHSDYLRSLYLNNDLSEGRYRVDGRPITVSDIRAPIFSVGTQWDHVAPWTSVFKIHLLTNTDITFLLTTGGHNAGIISEPGRDGRAYQVSTQTPHDRYVDPATWAAETPVVDGSWWPEWVNWLKDRSNSMSPPPSVGQVAGDYAPLCAAPGTYVLAE